MREFLITVAGIAGMLLIVPLMVWGGTGDWRHALHALLSYLKIMGGLILVGGGFGVVMAFAEHGMAIFSVFR
jgi:hypothetical protein